MVVAKVGCCGNVVPRGSLPEGSADLDHPPEGRDPPGTTFPQQPTLATTHLRNNHMYVGVNIGAFIKYYIGAFNLQLTEYNHNL